MLVLMVMLSASVVGAKYHSLSSRTLIPPSGTKDSYFGYSLGYQLNYAIIGAPHADDVGKLYKCEVQKMLQNPKTICDEINLNSTMKFVDRMSDFNYGTSSAKTKQPACLWSSMSFTKKYLSTCQNYYGECFIYDLEANEVAGHFDLYQSKAKNDKGRGRWMTMTDRNKTDFIIVDFTSDRSSSKNLHIDAVNHINLNTLYKVKVWSLMDGFSSLGNAVGLFFTDVNFTIYAISTFSDELKGSVNFLTFEAGESNNIVIRKDTHKGTLFGAEMLAADFDGDNLSELIVSAPAYFTRITYESGAVHIYKFGSIKKIGAGKPRTIFSTIDGERFGTAIATADIDGDGIPELFVGAPYITGIGKVYIFSGAKIRQLIQQQAILKTKHSDLKTSVLIGKEFEGFGSSLHVLPDIDENGCDELLIGAPYQANTVLFRCVPTINVTLSSSLLNYETVPENVTEFKMQVCLNMSYPKKPETVGINLVITNNIKHKNSDYFKPLSLAPDEATYNVQLLNKPTNNCKDITINVGDDNPGRYSFRTTAKVNKNIHEIKEFDVTWVEVNGTMNKEFEITRGCDGNAECVPKLAMTLTWSIGNDYQLGSSTSENITISVTNNGTSANKVCIKVKPVGMRLLRPDTIYLPTPFTKSSNFHEVVHFDMNSTTNEDKTLQVIVALYKRCDEINIYSSKPLRSNVLISDTYITVSKFARNVDVKNVKHSEENIKLIIADHYYNITNLYNVPWNKLNVDLFVKKEAYINNINLHGAEADDCQMSDINNTIKYSCIINIKPLKSTKLHITMNVLEDIAKNAMINGRVNIESKLHIHIDKDILDKELVLESEVIFQELKMYQNKLFMILLFSFLGLLLLIIIIYALYKNGFFARKQKTKLHELKREIRRQSVRRNTIVGDEPLEDKLIENISLADEVFANEPNEISRVIDDGKKGRSISLQEVDLDIGLVETSF